MKRRVSIHLTDVRVKIADLEAADTVLARTAALCGGGDRPECPVLESLLH